MKKNKLYQYGILFLCFFILMMPVFATITLREPTGSVVGSWDASSQFVLNSNGNLYPFNESGLQDAIDNLTNGGTVHIPVGYIEVSTPINVTRTGVAGIIIQGTGEAGDRNNGTCLQRAFNTDTRIMTMYTPANTDAFVTLRNIGFDGEKNQNTIDRPLLHISRAEDWKIEDCVFYNSEGYGIQIEGDAEVWTITDCFFWLNDDDDININGAISGIIENCEFDTTGNGSSILAQSCSDLVITNNHISTYSAGTDGIDLKNNVRYSKIIGNSIGWCDGHGLNLFEDCKFNTIVGNVFESNGKVSGSHIKLNDGGVPCKYNTITGNTLCTNTSEISSVTYGVDLAGLSHNNTVSGNTMYGSTSESIDLAANTKNNFISSNILSEGINDQSNGNNHIGVVTIYAELSSSVDQTFAATGKGYNITFNTNDGINGITHSTTVEPQNITIVTSGVYVLNVQPQVHANAGASGYFHLWLRKDTGGGFADIANSNIELTLESNNEDVITLIESLSLNAGDVIRINASVGHTGIELDAQTPANEPAIPSIIFSIYRIGS